MTAARCCQTEVISRRIVFGKAGVIELECCECEASRTALKYAGAKDAADRETKQVNRRRRKA